MSTTSRIKEQKREWMRKQFATATSAGQVEGLRRFGAKTQGLRGEADALAAEWYAANREAI